jgi:hypothetical protein
MSTTETKDNTAEVLADLQAVADAMESGRPVAPDVARRVRERSDQARRATEQRLGVQDIGARIIREMRDAG